MNFFLRLKNYFQTVSDFSVTKRSQKNLPRQDFGIVSCIAISVHYRPNKRELGRISYSIGTYKLLRRDSFWLYWPLLEHTVGIFLLLVVDSGMFHLTFLFFLFLFADHWRYWNRKWLWKVKQNRFYRYPYDGQDFFSIIAFNEKI